jgi:hypothetical protein
MPESKKEMSRKRPYRVNVRLSEEEWKKIEADEKLLRWEKATILRDAYLSRKSVVVLMDKEGEKKFLSEFNRIGNNINQLTRRANSGENVSDQSLEQVRDELKVLFRFAMRFDGIR